ncbi:DgyrCDS8259 [Dimorphilus gyrociliatus]|uniref:DgyrCDS8259 n=1 Tax=Dimorphilus gyrociliatus TaxID=2664684 RepID=A0A7I8VTL5_9ANNE|nr:DgyrCDS8259 [Dimorphilus gyrociliatus]
MMHLIKEKHKDDDIIFVTADDSIWLQDSIENRSIIHSVIKVLGKPDVEKYKSIFMNKLINQDTKTVKYEKLVRYATNLNGRFVWLKEGDFKVDEHVYMSKEKEGQNETETFQILADMASKPLKPNRAMWEFIVLPQYQENQKHHYCLFRIHHSVADGVGLTQIFFEEITDKIPKMITKGGGFGTKSMSVEQIVKAIFRGPARIFEKLFFPADSHCLHGPKLTGVKNLAWSEPVDLALIKEVKEATGTTVNDVLMGCLALTFREYFERFSHLVPKEIKCYVPVDLRKKDKCAAMDNQFSLLIFPMPIDLEVENHLEYVKEVKKRMDELKNSPDPIVGSLFLRYAMSRFPKWVTQKVFDFLAAKCTMVLSNVPGPAERISIGGEEVEGMIFWPPQRANCGLGVSVYSYDNQVRLGIFVDKTLTCNPKMLTNMYLKHLNRLVEQVRELKKVKNE